MCLTFGEKDIVGTPRKSHQIHAMNERIDELKGIKKSLNIANLIKRNDYQVRINQMKEYFRPLYGTHPGMFWEKRKHFVSLPYEPSSENRPHRSKAIPMDKEHTELCRKEIDELLKLGLIKPSKSPWGCFGFYVNKHSEIVRGKPRLVINYKPLNDCLAYDSYPLPKPSDILAKLKNAKVFSKFDVKSGFWQICIDPKDTFKTGFTVPRGHFEWNVMPFGLKNAPSAFQRGVMDKTFEGLEDFVQVYIDDLLVFSEDLDLHFKHLKIVRARIWDNGLVLSESKAVLFQTVVQFLGYQISAGSHSLMGHSLDFVDKFPDIITDRKQLQRFLGCLNYVSHFYEHCAATRNRLNKQLKKDALPWGQECTKAVKSIKAKVRHLPTLHLVREDWPMEIYCDASDIGWGAALVQIDSTIPENPIKQIWLMELSEYRC